LFLASALPAFAMLTVLNVLLFNVLQAIERELLEGDYGEDWEQHRGILKSPSPAPPSPPRVQTPSLSPSSAMPHMPEKTMSLLQEMREVLRRSQPSSGNAPTPSTTNQSTGDRGVASPPLGRVPSPTPTPSRLSTQLYCIVTRSCSPHTHALLHALLHAPPIPEVGAPIWRPEVGVPIWGPDVGFVGAR
jgi:hypothetical protein